MPQPRRTTHEDVARRLGLTITDTNALTIERRRHGRGFTYRDSATGRTVNGARRREIEALVLPPAWEEVRVSPEACTHLQAVGRDGKRRVQYRYHEDWARVRDAVKTERLIRFGRALPRIRAAVEADMKRPLNDRRGVTATAVRLIDRQLLRVGSEQYLADGTRGASTLANRSVKVARKAVELTFRAKAGKRVNLRLKDTKLARRVRKLRRRGGKRLFSWRSGRKVKSVNARLINAYLTDAGGAPVSAKDFRTFAGSALALERLCEALDDEPSSLTTRRRATASAVRDVSERLRNTPAVARSSYIHPSIVAAFEDGTLDPNLVRGRRRRGLDAAETGLMGFLKAR